MRPRLAGPRGRSPDNAAAERFFGGLGQEFPHGHDCSGKNIDKLCAIADEPNDRSGKTPGWAESAEKIVESSGAMQYAMKQAIATTARIGPSLWDWKLRQEPGGC